MQLLKLILLVWSALLYSGIGNAEVALRDVVAKHIEARVQAYSRQIGTATGSRLMRSDIRHEMSSVPAVSSLPVLLHPPFVAGLPLPSFFYPPFDTQALNPRRPGLESREFLRWQTPLNRAPPLAL